MEDVGPLVVAGGDGPGVLEPVDGALDLVAAFVNLAVEAGGPAASERWCRGVVLFSGRVASSCGPLPRAGGPGRTSSRR